MSQTSPNTPASNDVQTAVGVAYQQVLYPGHSYVQGQPDRLATIATLYGLAPPPPERARVLELGCGDGSNLLPVAYTMPGTACVGVDLAEEPVARGNGVAAELGLRNVTLRAMDVAQLTADFGHFDYVIAHGLYSWVPPAVADKVLEICKANLSPGGIAYVSYNTYPGCRLREVAWDIMRYHTAGFPTPREKVGQGRAILKFIADAKEENDPWGRLLRWELEHVGSADAGLLFHDDLSPENHPVYFHEFASRAARHGLQFLSEAHFQDSQYVGTDPAAALSGAKGKVAQALARLAAGLPPDDVVAVEQYADFLRGRKFRHTVLCHQGAEIRRPPEPSRVESLYATALVTSDPPEPDLSAGVPVRFTTARGSSIVTRRPVAKAALLELSRRRPRPLHFDQLLAAALDRLGPAGAATAGADLSPRAALAALLLTAYASNVVQLRTHVPTFVTEPTGRPTASALARAQAKAGTLVTDLLGTHVNLTAPLAQRLLLLCDGTRDLDALVRDLSESVAKGEAAIEQEGRRVTDPAQVARMLRVAVDDRLRELARLALLVA